MIDVHRRHCLAPRSVARVSGMPLGRILQLSQNEAARIFADAGGLEFWNPALWAELVRDAAEKARAGQGPARSNVP